MFNALHIGYSGLNAAQVGIDVTGHNIANAETQGYNRQRVVSSAAYPTGANGAMLYGNGVEITEIARVFDTFVFNRYVNAGEDKANSDLKRHTLEQLSTYFPDIDGIGIKADLQSYFDLWQSLADNPDSNSIKIALAQQSQTLTNTITQTHSQIFTQQQTLDAQLVTYVEEVNRIGEEIAHLNLQIAQTEGDGLTNANDLRDKRGLLEESLAKLIGGDVFQNGAKSKTPVSPYITEEQGFYNIQVGGVNLVDGSSFHRIGLTSEGNANGFHDLYYERQDGKRFSFEQSLLDGKIGAILEQRGTNFNSITGEAEGGILQDTINMLDALAQGLIENTNNIYAQSPAQQMVSNYIPFDATQPLVNTDNNFEQGSFDIVVYDVDGNAVATRTITIDMATAMGVTGTADATTIIGQIEANSDDNSDGNATNDIDDFLQTNFNNNHLSFYLDNALKAQGYSFVIRDSSDAPTNFAGTLGMNRFFDGNSADTIALNAELLRDTSQISAGALPVDGDNQVANKMVELQYGAINFYDNGDKYTDTIYGFYDSIATNVGSHTNSEIIRNDSINAQFSAIETEYQSISKVSIDEELTNLIRYQTAYGAAAKVISTVDQMMTTLLGMKQ
jgi:flagellar hook-associated protein 1